MDSQRFEQAVALRDSGRVEEALRTFVALRESAANAEEKASLLVNEVRCYRLLGQLAEAKRQLSRARRIAPQTHLLLYLDYEEAILHWHEGQRETSLQILDDLHRNRKEILLMPEHRDLYERVQSSRGMLLTELAQYKDAVALLEECLSFDPRVIDKEGVFRDLGGSFRN